MVSMWFKQETSLVTMIGLRKIMKEELDEEAYKIHGQNVKARLEVSPQRRPLTKTQALFFKGLKEVGGGESEVRAFHGKRQISFFVGRDIAAKFTCEGEGHANEEWVIEMHVVSTNVCRF